MTFDEAVKIMPEGLAVCLNFDVHKTVADLERMARNDLRDFPDMPAKYRGELERFLIAIEGTVSK